MKNRLSTTRWLFLLVLLAGPSSMFIGCAAGPASDGSSQLEINLAGKVTVLNLDSGGGLTQAAELSSADGKVNLSLPSGTVIQDSSGNPLYSVTARVESGVETPPNDMFMGSVFSLAPEGIKFSPAAQLSFSYDPVQVAALNKMMPLLNETSLCVGTFRNGNWIEASTNTLDSVNYKVTGPLEQGTKFALLMHMPNASTCPMHQQMMALAAQNPPTTEVIPPSASQPAANAVKIVVAGYINHGPMAATVQAIKDVLAKYGSKVDVTWVDLDTTDGAAYFKTNNLTAHMNVIISGKYTYKVNGKDVTFQWFEGQQWTKQDLDTVLSGLVAK
jgi:hypothetical protein